MALLSIFFYSLSSCSSTDACEDANTGTLVVQNTRTNGVLKLFFNQEPRSGNSAGDLNILPGETASMDQLAGQIAIFALLDLSSCNPEGTVCDRRTETLEGKTIDLSACEEFNIAY